MIYVVCHWPRHLCATHDYTFQYLNILPRTLNMFKWYTDIRMLMVYLLDRPRLIGGQLLWSVHFLLVSLVSHIISLTVVVDWDPNLIFSPICAIDASLQGAADNTERQPLLPGSSWPQLSTGLPADNHNIITCSRIIKMWLDPHLILLMQLHVALPPQERGQGAKGCCSFREGFWTPQSSSERNGAGSDVEAVPVFPKFLT